MSTPSAPLKRTALYDLHLALGARMVPFAGWEMPLQYTGILAEARAVRSSIGLFDVSHMGRLRFHGPEAATFLDRMLPARIEALGPGRARYTFLLNTDGGIIDDCIVSRSPSTEDEWMLVVNAANHDAAVGWLERWLSSFSGVVMRDITRETVMIAAQGPRTAAVLDSLLPQTPSTLRPFALAECRRPLDPAHSVADAQVTVSRTGYTGEDGFELVTAGGAGESLWRLLLDRGAVPCGLGARDSLRLEAGLFLHGNDMDPSTTPLEAGLERFVALDGKGDFVGKDALLRQREQGLRRRLVGFAMQENAIPRHGYAITDGATVLGSVTSGGYSPSLDRGIGLGYVPAEFAAPGARLAIDLRGRSVPAQIVALPFYRRP